MRVLAMSAWCVASALAAGVAFGQPAAPPPPPAPPDGGGDAQDELPPGLRPPQDSDVPPAAEDPTPDASRPDPTTFPAESPSESRGPIAEETILDEQRVPPPTQAEEPFCVACVLIGVGAVVLIGAIPLVAKVEAAGQRRDDLRTWIHDMGGANADLGFVAGYGIAKANDDELKYGVAAGVVGGAGLIVLSFGIGILIYEGEFLKGPKENAGLIRVGQGTLNVLPTASHEGAGLGFDLSF